MKKGRRPRRRPRLKLSDRAGPDQCPVPGENALFPAQIAGFLAVSRPVPVYPVFLNYVVPVQWPCGCCVRLFYYRTELEFIIISSATAFTRGISFRRIGSSLYG